MVLPLLEGHDMTHLQARIVGEVSYREGDGIMLIIPPGPCQIEREAVDVTITWVEDGVHGATAMPRGAYDAYLANGALVVD